MPEERNCPFLELEETSVYPPAARVLHFTWARAENTDREPRGRRRSQEMGSASLATQPSPTAFLPSLPTDGSRGRLHPAPPLHASPRLRKLTGIFLSLLFLIFRVNSKTKHAIHE